MSTYQIRLLDNPSYNNHVRGSRFFKLYNNWYFMTREGIGVGPYIDLNAAKRGLEDFIKFITQSDHDEIQRFFCQFKQDEAKLAVHH